MQTQNSVLEGCSAKSLAPTYEGCQGLRLQRSDELDLVFKRQPRHCCCSKLRFPLGCCCLFCHLQQRATC